MSPNPPPVSSEKLSDYPLRIEHRGWRKWAAWLRTPRGLLAVAIAGLLAVGATQVRPLLRAVKAWRVQKLIAQSEEAFRAGDKTTETRLLGEAVSLLPAHALTWRARARHHERHAEAPALFAYFRLLSAKEATIDDAERASRLAVLRGSPDTRRKISELSERIQGAIDRPPVMALRARVLADGNSLSEALACAEEAVARDASEGPARLLLANLLIQSASRAEQEKQTAAGRRAIAILDELARGADETAADALEVLLKMSLQPAAVPLLTGHDVDAWLSAAERHPLATANLRNIAWNAALAAKRGDEAKFFTAFVEKWREAPLSDRLAAGRWLNQKRQPTLTLALTEPQKDVSEDWFVLHLDALAASGQWAAVLEALDAGTGQAAELPAALRTLFRLKARAESGEPVDADEEWREIQVQMQNASARTQIFIAQYAEMTGEQKQAAAIFRRVLKNSSATSALNSSLSRESKLACYAGALRCTPPTASVAEILPILAGLISEFPEYDEARNDALYLRLLAGEFDATTRADLAKMGPLASARLAHRTTAALLELRTGNTREADDLYQGVAVDWGIVPDAFKAVRAAVLTAAGKEGESQALRAKIREQKLRPEEVALLHPQPAIPPSEPVAEEASNPSASVGGAETPAVEATVPQR